jgi:preprotein translocase subunit SecA
MVAVVYDAEWFNVNQGLRNEGLCLEYLSDAHAIVNEICSYFGPKLNKNGWKYEEYVEPIVATKIKKLWRRVYSQEDVTNKQLSFKFARGLVVEYKGFKVNWAEHAASARTLRKNVKIKKAANEEKKMHFEEVFDKQRSFNIENIRKCFVLGIRRKCVF